MTKSMMLLNEALFELHELASEAQTKNSLIYEGMGYTPFQVILLEAGTDDAPADDSAKDKKSFLKRTANAVTKLRTSGEAAIEEMQSLRDALQTIGMEKTTNALNRAIKDLEKKLPGKSFLGKIGTGAGMAIKALFGDEDDPAEAVAEIVADANAFQALLNNVVKSILATLNKIDPVNVVDGMEQEATADEKKVYVDELKAKMMDTTLNDMVFNPDWEKFRAETKFDEKTIKAAVAASAKPATGMFSGLKSLGASLGIGLGGDVPFKQYYGTSSGKALIDDIIMLTPNQIQTITKKIPKSSDADTDGLAAGLGALGQQKEKIPPGILSPPTVGGSSDQTTNKPPNDSNTQTPEEDDRPPAPKPGSNAAKVDKVLTGAGIEDASSARAKFAELIGLELVEAKTFSIYDMLHEKVIRYQAVVDALKDHLPQDEGDQAIAIKKLSDEMKVELGSEFEIVDMPDIGAAERANLRNEVEALRQAISSIKDPTQRGMVIQTATDNLRARGVADDVAEDLPDLEVDLDQALKTVTDDATDAIMAAVPNNPTATSLVSDDDNSGLIAQILKATATAAGGAAQKGAGKLSAWAKDAMQDLKPEEIAEFMVLAAASKKGDKEAQEKFLKKVTAKIGDKGLDDMGLENLKGLFDDSPEVDKDSIPKQGEIWLTTSKKVKKPTPVKIMGDPKKGKINVAWLTNLKSKFPKDIRDLKDGPMSEEEALKVKQEAFARIAVARMRGWLLNETNNFRRISNLTYNNVVSEFYSRGGNNELIRENSKNISCKSRWSLLAGVRNE
jgi:hypothetical protein